MTIQYGLTEDGFVNKPLPVVRDEVNASLRDAFGSSIDLSDRSVLGILVGIFAERIALLWDLLETITTAQDPSKATGFLLEAIAALTGTLKPKATQSTATLTLTGTPVTLVPALSRAATAGTGAQFETASDVTLTSIDPWATSTIYALGDRVTHVSNVYQCIQAGTSASSGGPVGIAPDSTLDGSCLWTFLGGGTADADVEAASVDFGSIIGSARDINQIATPIGGWTGVINIESAILGRDVATDAELRNLREAEIANAATGTIDAIRANLLLVADVTAVTMFVNNGDVTDGNGVPPHSVESLVQGGDDQAIFDALLANVAAGIPTFGTVTGTSLDAVGTSHAMAFSRPVSVPLYIVMSVTVDEQLFPSDGATQVANAIVAYGASQSTGKDAVAAALAAQAFTILGVLDVSRILLFRDVIQTPVPWVASTVYSATPTARSVVSNDGGRVYICTVFGTSGSTGPTGTGLDIVDGTVHWSYAGANVTVGPLELMQISFGNVTVNVTDGTP